MPEQSPLIPELSGSRSVLVVDDAAVVRRLAFRLLAEAGYRVFEAGSATEALEVLGMARGQVQLVLIDVVMPEVSGVDLARMIREISPMARVIFMSAFPAEVLVREGLRDPRVQFLAKPFTREELLATVARVFALPSTPAESSNRPAGRADG
jgi:two-component system cell cycle sensor histidine kinase/response regulator CckA